jgi:hypothetical protein
LFRLHEDGVSEPVINAMQTARVYDVESHPLGVLPVTKRPPPRSDLRFFNPSRPAVNLEHFGPSILAPPQRPAVETLAPTHTAISPP